MVSLLLGGIQVASLSGIEFSFENERVDRKAETRRMPIRVVAFLAGTPHCPFSLTTQPIQNIAAPAVHNSDEHPSLVPCVLEHTSRVNGDSVVLCYVPVSTYALSPSWGRLPAGLYFVHFRPLS